MYAFATSLINRSGPLRRWSNRVFYQMLARLDTGGEVTLMNYGYADIGGEVGLMNYGYADTGGEVGLMNYGYADPAGNAAGAEHPCLRLYHHVASGVDLRGLDVLEIGSGRGGGAAFVSRTHAPRSMAGVDYSDRAVAFCQRAHRQPGLEFVHGDAEALPFEDGRFDAALNVESSHCYGSMARFLAEAHRVLRPGGHLLWADFRPPGAIPALRDTIRQTGFEIVREETITPNILAAMAFQGEHNRALIDRKAPRPVRWLFYHFAGVDGTHIHSQLRSGALEYLYLVLRKSGLPQQSSALRP